MRFGPKTACRGQVMKQEFRLSGPHELFWEDRSSLLILRIAQRDHAAMEEFYGHWSPRLLSFILRLVRDRYNADEVLQDVYRQIWLQAGSWRADRGGAISWVYTIARSRAFDNLRRNRRDASMTVLQDYCGISCIGNPEEERHRKWLHGRMTMAMKNLPDEQRELIDLAFYEGYSHSEIAWETGLPLGTIKSRIRSALMRIREAFADESFAACA